MKTRLCLYILTFLATRTGAQNIVLNGDFELNYNCPSALSMIDTAQFWINSTINGTPDYFHQCANPFFAGVPANQIGYQLPHSGEGYAGLYLWQGTSNYREFMEGQLSSPLTAGTCYHFEMFLSLANFMKHTASNIGVYFSDTLISGLIGAQMQNFIPQIVNAASAFPDTASWMQVSGNYTATGGENFIIIGNFDVDGAVNSVLTNPFGLWPGTHVYVDDVSLTVCTGINDPGSASKTYLFPNPVIDIMNVETDHTGPAEIIIYNFALQKLISQRFTGHTTFDLSTLESGIYFYKIHPENGITVTGKFNKF